MNRLSIERNAVEGTAEPCKGVTGRGAAHAHHGEIMQGVFEGECGQMKRGLVTLLCSTYQSTAEFMPAEDGEVRVEPGGRAKAKRAAQLTLGRLRTGTVGGRLRISSNIPMGLGLGSSTADVTATIRAVANALEVTLPAAVIADLAVQAEVASDSLMFDERAVLFAQREGRVIEDFFAATPPLVVVGCDTDLSGRGVDTLEFEPATYSWREVETFRVLRGLLRRALRCADPALLGRVATASANINQRFLPKPDFDWLKSLASQVKALGIQVAHSGTVVGLLFSPLQESVTCRAGRAQELLERQFGSAWHFHTAAVCEDIQ
jgi:uncharacterized protein involved in propanediol utilization